MEKLHKELASEIYRDFLKESLVSDRDISSFKNDPLARADFITFALETLYPETPIPLNHHSAYTLLIAVLLSAQCTDERVNKITPQLFLRADSPFEMVKLEVKEIEDICVSASKEYGLQIAMDKMEAEWKSMIFDTKEYRTSGTRMLAGRLRNLIVVFTRSCCPVPHYMLTLPFLFLTFHS